MTPFFDDGQVTLYHGHVLDVLRSLPSESVQCVVTSPPYWALRAYGTEPQRWADGYTGELGHEPTPQMFVAHLVEIFREVRRVLREDGVCFVNLGDSYSGSGKGPTGVTSMNKPGTQETRQGYGIVKSGSPRNRDGVGAIDGIPAKSLVLIPERFALAMQDAGWVVRSRIAWCKRAPMPESVKDRPTNAWEHIWMFTKSARYFWDQDAVKVPHSAATTETEFAGRATGQRGGQGERMFKLADGGRNIWSYWEIPDESLTDEQKWSQFLSYLAEHIGDDAADDIIEGFNLQQCDAPDGEAWIVSPEPEKMAHFATFPREIPRRCIAAATSERGECPHCGTPWGRVVERQITRSNQSVWNGSAQNIRKGESRPGNFIGGSVATTGWQPSCQCPPHEPVPQTVLDPFVGSGTTTQVARSMLRRSIGIDLNETYLRDIALRKNAQMALMEPA